MTCSRTERALAIENDGSVSISKAEAANWKNEERGKTFSTYIWKQSIPQSETFGDNNRQTVKVEYAAPGKKKLSRITKVQDQKRNLSAYEQSLSASTIKYVDGRPTEFTNCSVGKLQDFPEKGRTSMQEKLFDAAAGSVGSKSPVTVTLDCDRIDKDTCRTLKVWSDSHSGDQMNKCEDALKSLHLFVKNDEKGAAERNVAYEAFRKFNNSTNPLVNRDLLYETTVLENAYNAGTAKLEFSSAMQRVNNMLRACDSLGLFQAAQSGSEASRISGRRTNR